MSAYISEISRSLKNCFNPTQQASATLPPAWNGKHLYFSTNPLHKVISFVACGILAALGVVLSFVGYPVIGVPLTILSLVGIPYTNIYQKKRQIALDKYVKDFLSAHYGVKKDFSDTPKITWQNQANKIIIPFNIPTNVATGQDQDGNIVFFASVAKKEKTINVFTFDKAYLNKEFSIIVDQEEVKLSRFRKDISLFAY